MTLQVNLSQKNKKLGDSSLGWANAHNPRTIDDGYCCWMGRMGRMGRMIMGQRDYGTNLWETMGLWDSNKHKKTGKLP